MIELSPCPFCGGPPVAIAVDGVSGVVFQAEALLRPGGLYIDAHVFCHECGAQGESQACFAYGQDDVDLAIETACGFWNDRNTRNGDLYIANDEQGRNVWPKPTKPQGD